MQLDAEVFMALLRRLLPRVHKHLQQVGVGPLLYLPEWFLCLFARSLPFPTVLRVWDAFLSEGKWLPPGGRGRGRSGALGCSGRTRNEPDSCSSPPVTASPGPGSGCCRVPGCAEGDGTLLALGKQPSPRPHTNCVMNGGPCCLRRDHRREVSLCLGAGWGQGVSPKVDEAGAGAITAGPGLGVHRSGDVANGRGPDPTAHGYLMSTCWCQVLLWTLGPPE